MHLPAVPKWNKAVDGLDTEQFAREARDFERSFLPRDIAFPREGQIWEAIRDCQVGFLAWFSHAAWAHQGGAAFTQGPLFPCGPARMDRGATVRILTLDDPRPLSVSFVPVRYAELQDRLIPELVQSTPGYTHYQLTMTTARTFGFEKATDYFTECFKLVEG